MFDRLKVVEELKSLDIEKVFTNEPLYKHTTYKVGGPAQVFVHAKTPFELVQVIEYALDNNYKYFVIGAGSNILFSDGAFEGIVITTRALNTYDISGHEVYAECGTSIIALAMSTARLGLSGLEFASGIPGLVGGAVFMNAGAYNKDIASILKEVWVYRNRKLEWVPRSELEYSYRHSSFQDHRDWVILAARFELSESDPDVIKQLILERKIKRQDAQPYDAYSAGSVFKNPDNGSSWELIDQAGLRGFRINDAHVSLKHPNFIVNADRASARDVYSLIKLVQNEIKKKFDISLKVEVELVNFDE